MTVRRAAELLDKINGLYDDDVFESRDALLARSVFAWVLEEPISDLEGWEGEEIEDLESLLWLSPGVLANPEMYDEEY